MEVIEVVRSWVAVATTWMVDVLGLATRDEVVELRRRVDELQAIVGAPVDGEPAARRPTIPPNMKDAIARAGAALADLQPRTTRARPVRGT